VTREKLWALPIWSWQYVLFGKYSPLLLKTSRRCLKVKWQQLRRSTFCCQS